MEEPSVESAETLDRHGNSQWLRSPKWDLTWISLSSILMIVPYSSYFAGQWLGLDPDGARKAVNALIAFLIGGPHMYATHTRSTLDPTFRSRHSSMLAAGILIPAFVIYFGVNYFVFLLTFFFFFASVHVLEQIVFIVDSYNERERRALTNRERAIEYAVVITSLYPMATYRFVHGTFHIGHEYLFFPEWLKFNALWWLAAAAFATALTLYISKTWREFRNGEGNIPKTILISVTVIACFVTPFFDELDVAFQGLNTWHSLQYLGLTWYINRLRQQRGEIIPSRLRRLSGPGSWWRYYGFTILLNMIAIVLWGVMLLTRPYTGLNDEQAYYIVILCFLLTHYYHDHMLFREPVPFGLSSGGALPQTAKALSP